MRYEKNKAEKINPTEWAVFAVVLLVAHALGYFFQDTVQVNNGLGWDGAVYYQMAQQAFAGQEFTQRLPFVYRQLMPTLAAFFVDSPGQLRNAFIFIALFCGTVAAVLILLLLRSFVSDWRLRVIAASLYPLHWFCSPRSTYFVNIDTGAIMVMATAAAFICAQQIRASPQSHQWKWIALLSIVCFIAVWHRPSSLPLFGLLAPLCAAFPERELDLRARLEGTLRRLRPVLFVPLAAGGLAYWWVSYNAQVTGIYSKENYTGLPFYLNEVYEKSLAHYLQGVFLAYGPSLALVLWQWRIVVATIKEHWHWLLFIGITIIYSVNTTVRLVLYASPLYIILLGIALQQGAEELKKKKILVVVLLIGQAISQRLFWPLPTEMPVDPSLTPPDTPIVLPFLFTPFTSDFLFYDLHPDNNRGIFGMLVVIQYVSFITVVLFFLNLRGGNDPSRPKVSKKKVTRGK